MDLDTTPAKYLWIWNLFVKYLYISFFPIHSVTIGSHQLKRKQSATASTKAPAENWICAEYHWVTIEIVLNIITLYCRVWIASFKSVCWYLHSFQHQVCWAFRQILPFGSAQIYRERRFSAANKSDERALFLPFPWSWCGIKSRDDAHKQCLPKMLIYVSNIYTDSFIHSHSLASIHHSTLFIITVHVKYHSAWDATHNRRRQKLRPHKTLKTACALTTNTQRTAGKERCVRRVMRFSLSGQFYSAVLTKVWKRANNLYQRAMHSGANNLFFLLDFTVMSFLYVECFLFIL